LKLSHLILRLAEHLKIKKSDAKSRFQAGPLSVICYFKTAF
jgi:hypothetical protein